MSLKRITVMVLTVLCLCSTLGAVAFADTSFNSIVAPAYDYADNATSELSVSGQTAYCTSKTEGDAVSITVEQTLEKYSGWFWIWNNVENASWSKTVNDNTIYLSTTISGLDSGTYRLRSVFKLTNSSGKTETITVYSDEKKVG